MTTMTITADTARTKGARMKLDVGGEDGTFECVFATLNVKDHDGDVIPPGSVNSGANVLISAWGHKWHDLTVGRGVVIEENGEAKLKGKFYLDTECGMEHYRTVKNNGDLQEWSFGFDVVEADQQTIAGERVNVLTKLRVFEVSPVLQGAGIDTRTTDIKSAKAKCPECGYDMAKADDDPIPPKSSDGDDPVPTPTADDDTQKAIVSSLLEFEAIQAHQLGVPITEVPQ